MREGYRALMYAYLTTAEGAVVMTNSEAGMALRPNTACRHRDNRETAAERDKAVLQLLGAELLRTIVGSHVADLEPMLSNHGSFNRSDGQDPKSLIISNR